MFVADGVLVGVGFEAAKAGLAGLARDDGLARAPEAAYSGGMTGSPMQSPFGHEDRHGKIIEICGQDGAPPYRVRWRDDHESAFFPASGTVVEHHPAGKPSR